MVPLTKKMGISPVTTAGPVGTELRTANSLRWISIAKVKAGGGTDAGRGSRRALPLARGKGCVPEGWRESDGSALSFNF